MFIGSLLSIPNCTGLRNESETTPTLLELDGYSMRYEEVSCNRQTPEGANLVWRISQRAGDVKVRM